MQSAIERFDIYTSNSDTKTKKSIKKFTLGKSQKRNQINTLISRVHDQTPQIEDAIAKSSPEMGLDPQMEPLITSFVSYVEDIYNEINDHIMDMKEFEKKLLDLVDIKTILASSDSAIQEASKLFPESEKNKSIKRAVKFQKNAYAALDNKKVSQAASLTTEAYYSIIDLLPSVTFDDDLNNRFIGVVDRITELTEIIANAEGSGVFEDNEMERMKTLISFSEEHAKIANQCIKDDKNTIAKKELAISDLLISKVNESVSFLHGH